MHGLLLHLGGCIPHTDANVDHRGDRQECSLRLSSGSTGDKEAKQQHAERLLFPWGT